MIKLRTLLLALCCLGICQAQSTWTLKNGEAIEGTVLRVTESGDAVLQTATGISNIPLDEMSQESIERLEESFAKLDLKKVKQEAARRSPVPNVHSKQPRSQNAQAWSNLTADQKMGIYLMGGGGVALLIGFILLLVAAFKENPTWGIALIVSHIAGLSLIISLVFFILHFNKAKLSFLMHVIGMGAIGGGVWMWFQAIV